MGDKVWTLIFHFKSGVIFLLLQWLPGHYLLRQRGRMNRIPGHFLDRKNLFYKKLWQLKWQI